MSSPHHLLATVVDTGFCIGCGTCSAVVGSPLSMSLTPEGRYIPVLNSETAVADGSFTDVCPFASPITEDALSRSTLTDATLHDDQIGRYRSLWAAYCKDERLRSGSSSGGMTSWFLAQLLQQHLADTILHVGPTYSSREGGERNILFEYVASTSVTEVLDRSKTRYYPVEMSGVLARVRDNPGRYAVVGLPCFIKGVRLLQRHDPVFRERIVLCVSLICGHAKSRGFAEALAWEQGVAPDNLAAIDFRVKNNVAADTYDVRVQAKSDQQWRQARNNTLFVADWGMGMFKYSACDYCDDVMGETADISFGDAWLPEFTEDPQGTNIVISRSLLADVILRKGEAELHLEPLTTDRVNGSQAAGLRHRREGLAYRLARADAAGMPHPPKRVQPNEDIPTTRKKVYDLRQKFVTETDRAFMAARAGGTFEDFRRLMNPIVRDYQTAYTHRSTQAWFKQHLPRTTRFLRQARRLSRNK